MRLLQIPTVALLACAPSEGSFELLTYNVAGLPEGLSSSHPEANHPLISPRLNAYDLVGVQEDFQYHELLVASLELPHQTEPTSPGERAMGDGLAYLSRFELSNLEQVQWENCSGVFDGASDCLAEKGFNAVTVTLADGVSFELYNLHADAGGGDEDAAARAANFTQLTAHLKARAAGKAVIVVGDTNLKVERGEDATVLSNFLADNGLTDACRALKCPTESIDRVMFRSADALELTPTTWRFATEFVTDSGEQLSDHQAVHVSMSWRLP